MRTALFHAYQTPPALCPVTPPVTPALTHHLTGAQSWGQRLPLGLPDGHWMSHWGMRVVPKKSDGCLGTPRPDLLAQAAVPQTLLDGQP